MARFRGWTLTERRFLSAEEVRRLRECARERAKGLRNGKRSAMLEWIAIEIALETGLRVGEIAQLHCDDITLHEKGGSVLVRCGKGGKSRVVKFGRPLSETLSRYLDWKERRGESLNAESALLLSSCSRSHLTPRALQKMFHRVASRAGISGHRFHDLRHTYASHLHRASGNNLRMVQRQLGHSRIATTQIYADLLDGETEKAVNRLYEK